MIDRASLRSRAGHYIKRPDTVAGSERGGSRIFYLRLTPGNLSSCHNARLTNGPESLGELKYVYGYNRQPEAWISMTTATGVAL